MVLGQHGCRVARRSRRHSFLDVDQAEAALFPVAFS
jgi:hypothetical protein